jgi:hypothetical protein
MEEWLTPTLATTMPGVARAIPWLLLLDALEVVGAVVAGIFLPRAAPRMGPREASHLRDTARQLERGRFVFRVLAVLIIATWVAMSAAFGISAEKNELLLVLTLGAVVLPAYVTITILSRTMSRAAEIAGSNPQAPKGN